MRKEEGEMRNATEINGYSNKFRSPYSFLPPPSSFLQ